MLIKGLTIGGWLMTEYIVSCACTKTGFTTTWTTL